MASKKLPEYVHCAKCGYRGVDPKHDCTKVRAAAAAVVDQAAKREQERADVLVRLASTPVTASTAHRAHENAPDVPMRDLEAPLSIPAQLGRLCVEHRRTFGRGVEYGLATPGCVNNATAVMVEIRQRCAACCNEVTKRVHVHTDEDFWGLELGAAARKAYLLHRCPPVAQSLLGFTWDELEELHAGLERDTQLMAERLAEVEKLKKARIT